MQSLSDSGIGEAFLYYKNQTYSYQLQDKEKQLKTCANNDV